MKSAKKEIQHLHNLLIKKDKWYLDFTCPEIEEYQEIAEKAKSFADYELGEMSESALYGRYSRWRNSSPIIAPGEDYYMNFINDVVWNLGLSCLKGLNRDRYEESINLTIKFL